VRFVFAVMAVWLAICLVPENRTDYSTDAPTETLYPSHHCADGHSWQEISSDADSITVRCYSDPDPDEQQDPGDAADLELDQAWQRWEQAQLRRPTMSGGER